MVRSQPLFSLILPWLVWSCGGESRSSVGSMVRDSSGVQIVENQTMAWGEGEGWRLGERPLVDIGGLEGDSNYELFRAVSAVRLTDGRIAIANSGTDEIRFYDADGVFLSSAGGEGGGPGEFQGLAWVRGYRGDSLLAHDLRHRRLTVFDSRGNFGRSFPVRGAGEGRYPRASGPFGDGSILTYSTKRVGGDNYDVLSTIKPSGEPADSLGSHPGIEMYESSLNNVGVRMPLIFGRSTYYDTYGDLFFVASTDRYEFQVFSQDGLLRSIVKRDRENAAATEEDIQYVKEQRLNETDAASRELLGGLFEDMPIPATLPAFESIKLDAVGNVWIREYNRPGDLVPRWTVFTPEGEMLGTIALPERFDLYEIGDDYVLGRWRDDFDVEHVRVYELIR